MGLVPAVVRKRVLKPRTDELAKLILPGGGDFASRIWAGMKVKVRAVAKWIANGATETPDFHDALSIPEEFYDVETGSASTAIFLHAWKSISSLDKLSLQCELLFFVETASDFELYDISN